MTSRRYPVNQRTSAIFSTKRSAPWRRWLALYAVVCAVSLYSIEATHFHHSLAEQLNCPAGHAVGHSPANVYTPEFTPTFDLHGPCDIETVPLAVRPIGKPAYFIPQSHAPPTFIS